jgi:phage terminase small subunit
MRIRLDVKERCERFAAAYLANGGNAAAAILEARPELKKKGRTGAAQLGRACLAHAYTQQLLQDHKDRVAAELEAKTGLTIENVIESLRRLVMADPRKLFRADGTLKAIVELDDETASMVSSFEVEELYVGQPGKDGSRVSIGRTAKVKMWDKNSAIDKAMKHLGAYEKDNKQKPVTLNITADDAGVL